MKEWTRHLDRVLRGEATKPANLRQGEIEQPVGGLIVLGLALGALYGLFMGSYALFQKADAPILQLIATTLKVPALFFLTFAITFPSLYVFNALIGSRLSLLSVVRLLVIALSVMFAVLASLGPIVAFFSASTTSHSFMLILNVVFFMASGALGLRCILTTLNRLSIALAEKERRERLPIGDDASFSRDLLSEAEAGVAVGNPNASLPLSQVGVNKSVRPGALEAQEGLTREVKNLFKIWMLVFGFVGAQMAWVLRPFLGTPHHLFTWFRPRESSFFEAVMYALQHLFSK